MNTLFIEKLRQEFPILSRQVNGRPLVYLDNAATTQKPRAMLAAITEYYEQHNANIHRGVHTLGDESTQLWHNSRATTARFFGAQPDELLITRNSTEAMNQLVQMIAPRLDDKSTVAVTMLDHHSNVVPWQRAAKSANAEWLMLPVTGRGEIDMELAHQQLHAVRDTLRVLSVPLVSNVLGSVVDVREMTQWLVEWGVRKRVFVVVDAAQAVAHQAVSLEILGADAFTWSGHKLYGPMGIGGAVVRRQWLEQLEPALVGGGMIDAVASDDTTYVESLAERFTAGTPDVASLVGMAASLEWLTQFSWTDIQAHEHDVLQYAYEQLATLPQVQLIGPIPNKRIGSVAWLYDGAHAHEVAQVLDHAGVAVRSGHHCAMPLHTHFTWQATTRASFALYTTREEIDILVSALKDAGKVLA